MTPLRTNLVNFFKVYEIRSSGSLKNVKPEIGLWAKFYRSIHVVVIS